MKRINFWLGLLLFGTLIGLAIFFNQKNKQNQKHCKLSLDQIDKIEIVQDNVPKIVMENNAGVWLINGIVPVNREHLQQTFDIITRIEKKQRVNEHILFDIRQELMDSPEIKIWADGKIVKSFFIGPPISDSTGNYYMPSDDMLAYVVYVPGLRENLQKYFVTDFNYWRDRRILSGIINKVQYVSYHVPGRKTLKKTLTREEKQQLSGIEVVKYIDEKGLIDSLRWAQKHASYLFKIEFFNTDKIPQAKLTCYDLNHKYLVLFEDFGGNAVAALLTKNNIDRLKEIKD